MASHALEPLRFDLPNLSYEVIENFLMLATCFQRKTVTLQLNYSCEYLFSGLLYLICSVCVQT